MELKTYNGEYFERTILRYIIFFLIVGGVIIGAIFSNNIIGAVIILLFAGGYLFFLTKTNETITLKIEESWLTIGKKYPRNEISGFILEFHTKKQTIHNIVFITPKRHDIFTINDSNENLKNFATALGTYLPLLDGYEQTLREKFLRKIKL